MTLYNRHTVMTHTIDMTVNTTDTITVMTLTVTMIWYNRHDYCYDPEHTHNTIDMTVRYNRHDYCYDPTVMTLNTHTIQ